MRSAAPARSRRRGVCGGESLRSPPLLGPSLPLAATRSWARFRMSAWEVCACGAPAGGLGVSSESCPYLPERAQPPVRTPERLVEANAVPGPLRVPTQWALPPDCTHRLPRAGASPRGRIRPAASPAQAPPSFGCRWLFHFCFLKSRTRPLIFGCPVYHTASLKRGSQAASEPRSRGAGEGEPRRSGGAGPGWTFA